MPVIHLSMIKYYSPEIPLLALKQVPRDKSNLGNSVFTCNHICFKVELTRVLRFSGQQEIQRISSLFQSQITGVIFKYSQSLSIDNNRSTNPLILTGYVRPGIRGIRLKSELLQNIFILINIIFQEWRSKFKTNKIFQKINLNESSSRL